MNAAEITTNIDRLNIWKNGNGADGAEKRLQLVEAQATENEKAHLKIYHRLTMLTVAIGVLIAASVPDLLKLFGIML